MKRILKIALIGVTSLILTLLLVGGAGAFLMYDSTRDLEADIATVVRSARIGLYNRGYLIDMSSEDVRYVYENKCFRQCHGESAMITAVLSPAGWIQIVERMRLKENVDISGREVDLIVQYLERNYPTMKTKYSYETRKQVHKAVWRNDIGEGDIYTDVIYATPEYLRSIGAERLAEEYDLINHYAFIISFTVHEGEIELMEMDEISIIRTAKGEYKTAPPWRLRFQTADKHHYESLIRFHRGGSNPVIDDGTDWFELVIRNVRGEAERVFRWELPLTYPPEIITAEQDKVAAN